MKLRERYRTVINSDDEEELTEGEEANEIQSPDRKDLLQPSTPTGSRPSLISITEDHAVNILSQLTKSTPTKIHVNSAAH